jgi:hypothetical protein
MFRGSKPMTRYEFAVAIARLLNNLPPPNQPYNGPTMDQFNALAGRVGVLEARPTPDLSQFATKAELADRPTRAEVNDLIAALRREFQDELSRLGVRVDQLEDRVANLERRMPVPPRVTTSLNMYTVAGGANYESQNTLLGGAILPGRTIANGNNGVIGPFGPLASLPPLPAAFVGSTAHRMVTEKFSYTDFELRLTDRVTDRLSVNAALRSLGSTQEDPWAGEAINRTPGFVGGGATPGAPSGSLPGAVVASSTNGSGLYAREAYAVADLSDYSVLNIKGLNAVLGRQHTRIAQGLLYDNDLAPTDQFRVNFNLGPFSISGFDGTTNNQVFSSAGNPYLTTGAVANIGLNGFAGLMPTGSPGAGTSGAFVGFPSPPSYANQYPDDNEALLHADVNLFRIAGNPVRLGGTALLNGVQDQDGYGADLTIPLFNRTVGVEWVDERHYANSASAASPQALNVTVPIFRTNLLDLDFAYGKADSDFEYFLASSANPFARTYGEAIFDRPMALGAPLISGTGPAGSPIYAAAKQTYDFNGTVRLPISFLRRFPIDLRYYRAYGSHIAGTRLDLGSVYSIGTRFAITPGMDISVKYGVYNVPGPYPALQYLRAAADIGF